MDKTIIYKFIICIMLVLGSVCCKGQGEKIDMTVYDSINPLPSVSSLKTMTAYDKYEYEHFPYAEGMEDSIYNYDLDFGEILVIECGISSNNLLSNALRRIKACTKITDRIRPYDGDYFLCVIEIDSLQVGSPDLFKLFYRFRNIPRDTVEINSGNKAIFLQSKGNIDVQAKYCFKTGGKTFLTSQWISDLFTDKIGIVHTEGDLVADGNGYCWVFCTQNGNIKTSDALIYGIEGYNYYFSPRDKSFRKAPYNFYE